ncbi:MAG: hypothetical protein AMXMBFR58_09050 [Phycisphaerae bacterium]|nr:hypothetical protein [Phycisphaerales bacterium]MCK6476480.1 DUF192 domain-containing protein [Phycisphaerales bacterium]
MAAGITMSGSNVINLAGMALALLFTLLAASCDDKPADPNKVSVALSGKTYVLEIAADRATRVKGMSGRDKIPEGTGMLFVFPDREVQVQEFVMRDCSIPIDIIFLDRSGRITAMHAMKVEEPRKPSEPKPASPLQRDPYEDRLKRYSSRYAAQFVIEIAGGELEKLKLKDGDKVELDLEALKKRAS